MLDTCQKYDIEDFIHLDSYDYFKIKRDTCGLKQEAKLAMHQLVASVASLGYFHSQQAPRIWVHYSNYSKFYSCVDKFGDIFPMKKILTISQQLHHQHALQLSMNLFLIHLAFN